MAKNYAKRDFKKRPPAKAKKSFGFLWLVTGILIGGFGFGLIFLKKNVTIVDAASTPKEVVKASKPPVSHATHPPTPDAKTANTDDKTRYDFYTMLPNSQAATPEDASLPQVKPVKNLAEAEQSMLSKTNVPPAAPLATTPTTPTVNAPPRKVADSAEPNDLTALESIQASASSANKTKAVKKVLDEGTRYSVESGSFNSYELADAHKAELTMAGFDRVHIESYVKGDESTHHRVLIGQFKTKSEAVTVEKNLENDHFPAELITSP